MMNMDKVSMEREREMEKVAAHHLLSRDERDDAQWTLKEGLKSKLDVCHMLPLHSPRVRKTMVALLSRIFFLQNSEPGQSRNCSNNPWVWSFLCPVVHLCKNFLKHIKLSSFTHICRKIKNVAIYTFYPESFCVKNLATWNFFNVFFWLLSDWPSSLRWRGWLCVKFLQLNWTPLLSFRMTFSKSKYDARGGRQCRNKMEWPSF